jgi:hypothetical protein
MRVSVGFSLISDFKQAEFLTYPSVSLVETINEIASAHNRLTENRILSNFKISLQPISSPKKICPHGCPLEEA